MANSFTFCFLAFLTLQLTLRIWLARRQIAYVGAHRASVPMQFAASIPADAHRKAADYTVAKCRLGFWDLGLDTALLLAFTLGGGLAALDGFWQQHLDGLPQGIALIASTLVLSSLVGLPLAAYRQFGLEARFGFNRMTPTLFISDLVKQALLAALIGLPLLAAVLWLMAAMGSYWWLYVWLVWSGFNLLLLFIYPTWIAPLFNRFTPLADTALRDRIEALLQRCGFRTSGLFVMDGSRRSNHGNAYFTGFGKARRIVFFDTLLARLRGEEIEAVLAHELGHFVHRHVLQRIVVLFALSLAFLWLLGQLMAADWFYAGLGLPHGSTALALLLFLLVMPVFTFPFTPLASLLSRRHEFEADTYAAHQTNADDLVQALLKLYEDNAATLTPDPLHSAFYDSHPGAVERIAHLQSLRT
jgi:STE24 endopeptidase